MQIFDHAPWASNQSRSSVFRKIEAHTRREIVVVDAAAITDRHEVRIVGAVVLQRRRPDGGRRFDQAIDGAVQLDHDLGAVFGETFRVV